MNHSSVFCLCQFPNINKNLLDINTLVDLAVALGDEMTGRISISRKHRRSSARQRMCCAAISSLCRPPTLSSTLAVALGDEMTGSVDESVGGRHKEEIAAQHILCLANRSRPHKHSGVYQKQLKDLIRVVRQEDYEYTDPV
jgi:hypothetical protein